MKRLSGLRARLYLLARDMLLLVSGDDRSGRTRGNIAGRLKGNAGIVGLILVSPLFAGLANVIIHLWVDPIEIDMTPRPIQIIIISK